MININHRNALHHTAQLKDFACDALSGDQQSIAEWLNANDIEVIPNYYTTGGSRAF